MALMMLRLFPARITGLFDDARMEPRVRLALFPGEQAERT
jgi:hypothetical protein